MQLNSTAFAKNGRETIIPKQKGVVLLPIKGRKDDEILTITDIEAVRTLYGCQWKFSFTLKNDSKFVIVKVYPKGLESPTIKKIKPGRSATIVETNPNIINWVVELELGELSPITISIVLGEGKFKLPGNVVKISEL